VVEVADWCEESVDCWTEYTVDREARGLCVCAVDKCLVDCT
jgi:hypothetical protein